MVKLILGLLFLISAAPAPRYIEKISASMVSRQVQMGKSVTIKGNIYYNRNGDMVTRFVYPGEYVVISNKQGEIKIYNPAKNTVMAYQNFMFSTQSSQFYYFFSGKSADMGLTDIGFVPEKTWNEKGMVVTLWKLKTPDPKAAIQKVKLVYQQQNPIYMHYEDASGGILRKVFYYSYIRLENSSFPSITTEIVYENNDSSVIKTTYSDFKLNHQASNEYMNFKIPSNAKIEK